MMITYSATEIWSKVPSEIKNKTVWYFLSQSIRNIYYSEHTLSSYWYT